MEEIQSSIADLSRKLSFAYRINNQGLIHQLRMLIEGYNEEYHKKMDELFAQQQVDTRISVEEK